MAIGCGASSAQPTAVDGPTAAPEQDGATGAADAPTADGPAAEGGGHGGSAGGDAASVGDDGATQPSFVPPPPPPRACDVLGPGSVASLAYSPDGSLLAVGTFFGAVQIVRTADKRVTGTFWVGREAIASVDFSSDGARLLAVSSNDAVRIFRSADPNAAPVDVAIPGAGASLLVGEARFGPTGDVLASYGLNTVNSGGVFLGRFDPADGSLRSTTKLGDRPEPLSHLTLSADRTLAALVGRIAADSSPAIQVRRTATDQVLYSFPTLAETPAAAGFSQDATLFAGGPDADGKVRILRADSGQDVSRVPIKRVSAVAFSPDGSRLFMGEPYLPPNMKESLVTAQVATGMVDSRISRGNGGSGIVPLVVSPDGKTIASADAPGAIFIDAQTTAMLGSVPGPGYGMDRLEVSPDGSQVAIGFPDHLLLWTPATGAQSEIPAPRTFGDIFGYSPDGRRLAVAEVNEVRVIDVNGREQWRYGQTTEVPRAAAFSPDGTLVAVAYQAATYDMFDAATGQLLHMREKFNQGSNYVPMEFSPDGAQLAVGEHTSTVYDVKTSLPLWSLPPYTRTLAYSPDNSMLAIESRDYTMKLLRPTDGQAIRDIKTGFGYHFMSFSSDSRLLVFTEDDGRMRVLRLADDTLMKEMPSVGNSTKFSRTGTTMAAIAGSDGDAVWSCRRLPAF